MVAAETAHVDDNLARARRYRALAVLMLAVAAFVAIPTVTVQRDASRVVSAWVISIVAGWAVLVAIGRLTGARLLADERGRWSLSRCQLLVWNMLLISTFWTMFVVKLFGGVTDPLALGMDANLWWLIGISAGSFVASPLILARKQTTPGLLDVPRMTGRDQGVKDLFRGEDAGNADVVDIGRVQMVFFTLVTVFAYTAACWHAFVTRGPETLAFPAVSSDMVALLGISHATYLVNKNADRPAPTAANQPK